MMPADRDSQFELLLEEARSQLTDSPEGALSKAQDLLNARTDARAIRVIAMAHRLLGNIGDAESADLLAIRANSRDPQLRQATLANQLERWEEGEALARDYLERSGDDLLALTILAESLVGMRRAIEAEERLRRVVDIVPSFFRAQLALSKSLMLQCRVSEAIEILDNVLRAQPDSPEAWELLAEHLASARQFERAIEAHERVLSFDDQNPRVWVDFAATLRFAGQQSRSEKALRQAISIDPQNGAAWWAMANMAPEAISASDVKNIDQALSRSRDDDNAAYLHVAVATILDRSGDYGHAYSHFAAGKAIRKQASGYDPDLTLRENDTTIRLFNKEFFDERVGFGAADNSPIFIVGLPRSGSTLVEQILARHSQIEAAGELPIIFRIVDELDAEGGDRGYHRELLEGISKGRSRELGELYLRRSQEFRHSNKPFFTDKLHLNWLRLPLIKLILPNARVIDVRRNAADCCWSNFKIIFGPGHPASDDLGHIGSLYGEYVRMMDHAADWMGDRRLTVSYETLVENLEMETRRMLAFLGLDFEPACLNFHQLDGPVATISAEQVRRPLNREGIGRWKPYRQWLGPLFDVLGPFAEEA